MPGGRSKTSRGWCTTFAPGIYPHEFLKGWTGTLVVDAYSGYDATMSLEGRLTANCLAHARRKFDELVKANASAVAAQAIQRIAWLYRIEADAKVLNCEQRLQMRQDRAKPLWEELHVWLQFERTRVPEGSAIAKAIDYSLNHWGALSRFLHDGAVPIDNNHIENQMRPWAVGRNNANDSLMRTRLRRRAIPPSVEAPTASRLLRMITGTAGTASTPWAGGSELA
jgi:transposase